MVTQLIKDKAELGSQKRKLESELREKSFRSSDLEEEVE